MTSTTWKGKEKNEIAFKVQEIKAQQMRWLNERKIANGKTNGKCADGYTGLNNSTPDIASMERNQKAVYSPVNYLDYEESDNRCGGTKHYSQRQITNHEVYESEDDLEDSKQMLLLRKEALNDEIKNIEEKISGFMNCIEDEKQQIAHIERKEENVRKEIAHLHKTLSLLQQHKEGYSDKISSYQSKIKAERSRCSLVEQTLLELDGKLMALKVSK